MARAAHYRSRGGRIEQKKNKRSQAALTRPAAALVPRTEILQFRQTVQIRDSLGPAILSVRQTVVVEIEGAQVWVRCEVEAFEAIVAEAQDTQLGRRSRGSIRWLRFGSVI